MEGPSMSGQKSSWLRVHLGLLPTRTLVKRSKPVSTPTTSRAPATLSRAPDSPPPSATRSGTTTARALDTPPATRSGTTTSRDPDPPPPSATRSGTTTSRAPDPPPPSATRSGTTTSRASDSPPPSATRSGTTTSRALGSPPPSATRSGTTTSRVPASPIKDEEVQAGDEDTLDIDPLEESSDNVDSETKIAQLRRELRESEANLVKAATFGKDLLEANREIEERNEQLVREHTRQLEDLEQEKYSLSLQLANKESMERHRASEIECLQEKQKQETRRLKEGLDLEHSHEIQKVKTTCEDLGSDLELARIQNEQLKEQVNYLEEALEDARSKASITILDETTSSEERLSFLQEEVVSLNNEKTQLASRVKETGHELEQLTFTNHKLSVSKKEVEQRAEEEHQQCLTYSRSLQEAHKQLEELQAELDLMKLESTDPNKKGNSLFAEVEDRRQAIEKKMISLQLHHDALQKQLNHKKQQMHSLKFQIAGLLQMDRGRVAADQVERLEQMLSQSRSEVKELTHKLQTAQNQPMPKFTADQFEGAELNKDLDRLKRFYQSKLDRVTSEKDELERDLRSERMHRMSLEDQLLECQRSLYGAEREVQRMKSANVMIKLKMDELKAKLVESGVVVDKEVKMKGGYTEKVPIPDKYKKKANEPMAEKAAAENPGSFSIPKVDKCPLSSKAASATGELEPREPLTEKKANLSPTEAPMAKVAKKKIVSIMHDVTVVNDDGSQSQRSVKEDGEGSCRGRKRGGRVVTNAPHIISKGEKNECKQQ